MAAFIAPIEIVKLDSLVELYESIDKISSSDIFVLEAFNSTLLTVSAKNIFPEDGITLSNFLNKHA